MEILYLLIPIALGILALAIKMLFWAVRSGQYDDLDVEGQRILFDDAEPETADNKREQNQKATFSPHTPSPQTPSRDNSLS